MQVTFLSLGLFALARFLKVELLEQRVYFFFFLTLDTHYPVALIEGFKNQQ